VEATRSRDGTFVLEGDIDLANAMSLLDLPVDPDATRVVLDLGAVPFIDSTGLAAIVLLAERVGGELVLTRPTPHVRSVLEMMSLHDVQGIVVEPEPGPRATPHHTFPHDASAPARARRLVEDIAAGSPAGAVDVARLLVSELVTNAVRHTLPGDEDDIGVSVWRRGATLYVEVRDSGRERRAGSEPFPRAGSGVAFLEALASDWGVRVDPSGRTVWFELTNADT
jgi:anti-anti-sigma factor